MSATSPWKKKLLLAISLISLLLGIFLIIQGANFVFQQDLSPSNLPAQVSTAPEESSVKTLIIEPDQGRDPVLSTISQAQKSIDLTIYTISDPEIISSLISAEKKGVEVRVLYNDNFFSANTRNRNQKSISLLTNSGIELKTGRTSFKYTHQKTFVIDGNKALIMTFNLEPSYFKTSRDFAIETNNPLEVTEIKNVFEADWQDQDFIPQVNTLVWSPDNSRQKILRLINNAQKSLDIYAEELIDQESMEALIKASKRGVGVKVISAKLWSNGGDINYKWRQTLNKEGVQAKAGDNLYIHAKMILADFNENNTEAFIGSENFSISSLDKNRELGILIKDKDILDELHQTFNKDWDQIK